MQETFKSIFLFVIFVAHRAGNVLLTCCTRETNENRKRMIFLSKVVFATSFINYLVQYQGYSRGCYFHACIVGPAV